MNRNRKILYGVILAAVLIVAIVATWYVSNANVQKSSGVVTLQLVDEYGAGSIETAFNQVINNFMAKYPDIYVRIEPMDQTTFNTVMPIWLASGKAPDVFQWLGGAQTQVFVDAGYLGNISSIYGSIKNYFSTAIQNVDMMYNGVPYAVPIDSLPYGCFYSVDIFNRYNIPIPTTFAQLVADCKTIQTDSKGTIYPFAIADGFPWLADECLSAIMSRAVSGDYMRGLINGTISWTDPQAEQCLYYLSELVPYLYPGATEITDYDSSAAWARGQIAMEIVGPWREGMILDDNASANIGWFPTPTINATYDSQLAAHSDVFVMSKDTKYPHQVELLLQYLASPEAQETFGVGSDNPVPNLQVPASAYNDTTMRLIIKSEVGATDNVMEIGLMTANQVAKNDDRTILSKLIDGQANYQQVAKQLAQLPWGKPNTS